MPKRDDNRTEVQPMSDSEREQAEGVAGVTTGEPVEYATEEPDE